MVIFYELETKEIKSIEDNVMTPTLPFNNTFEEKKNCYNSNGLGFITLNYELGIEAWNYNLCFDDKDEFVGLQPKETVINFRKECEVG